MPRPRGAIPSPRHKAFATYPHRPYRAVPDVFGAVPATLNMWGNDTYGDCVSAEEGFAKAIYSVMPGATGAELLMTDQEVISWARSNGYLNGADLTSVMDSMAQSGMTGPDGHTYTDGPYQSVDWTNDTILRSAIFTGPVKIGVAAGQFENTVTGSNGWIAIGYRQDNNEDHCVCLCGYGSLQDLCTLMKVPLPSGGADPTEPSYLLGTWGTIGIIVRSSLLAVTGEAWLRTPTTPQAPLPGPVPPPAPPPPVPTPPTPTPPVPPSPNPSPTPTPVSWTGTFTGTFAVSPAS
jgi:hypothetical protein